MDILNYRIYLLLFDAAKYGIIFVPIVVDLWDYLVDIN